MTYFLDPFGCVKNQVDAEIMMASLDKSGWVSAEDAALADLIIVNSCGFIESAKQESINAVLGWRKLYPEKKILLAGCLAQRYAKELADALPEADLLFGNAELARITEAAAIALGAEGEKTTAPPAVARMPPVSGRRPLLSLPGSAYVKINEGCNNRCTFCAIPLIRGSLRSRPPAEVLAECRELLDRGVKELCLIGQDIGSYGRDFAGDSTSLRQEGPEPSGSKLPALLEALSLIEGDFWVRLLYIHPDNFPLPILDTMERDTRFLPYFDIPFQHGSAKILKAMNRRGNAELYLALIASIRERLPDAVIRSTFMTGFPGEMPEDFAVLLDFQARARLDWLGCFTYSREEDTPAFSLKGRVAKKLAAERKGILEEQQIPITEKQMDRFVGRDFAVLVEEKFEDAADGAAIPDGSPAGNGLYLGRLPCQAPEVDSAAVIESERPLTPGSLVRGRVIGRAGFDLKVGIF